MANEKQPLVHPAKDGIHVGDMVVRPGPAFGTDGHLDTPESRERDRRKEEDARAAQEAGVVAPGPRNPLAPAEAPAASPSERAAADGVDASIADARAAQGDEPDAPILLRDPITGEPVGQM